MHIKQITHVLHACSGKVGFLQTDADTMEQGPRTKLRTLYAGICDGPLPEFMTIHEFGTPYSWIHVPPVGHCHKLFFLMLIALGFI